MKYSVIVPVYNAEETIQRCLESLLYHIPESAEVLVINDGSTDHSGEICRRFAEQYPAKKMVVYPQRGIWDWIVHVENMCFLLTLTTM